MITAAVDETALAADSMSTKIASIRSDTQGVANEIDQLEQGLDTIGAGIASLSDSSNEYLKVFE